MRLVSILTLFAAGLSALLVAGLAAALRPATQDAAPVLVIAAPWAGGPDAVVRRAGGSVIGPLSTPISILAGGTTPERLTGAGAWAVLDAAAIALFCQTETRG
jgi:hypothetical protein